MATEDNEYFMDILDTQNRYQDRHGQRLSSKKLKKAVLRVMDEEEEEIERNISDSKDRVDDISDSKEGVNNINDSKEGVDNIGDSDERVDAKSKEKAYKDYLFFRNEFETMNVFEQENNSRSRINPESGIIPDS